jgi:hypothetical protein
MDIILQTLASNPWFSVATAIVTLFSAIAAATPTPQEGSALAKIYKVVDFLALNIFKAKQK